MRTCLHSALFCASFSLLSASLSPAYSSSIKPAAMARCSAFLVRIDPPLPVSLKHSAFHTYKLIPRAAYSFFHFGSSRSTWVLVLVNQTLPLSPSLFFLEGAFMYVQVIFEVWNHTKRWKKTLKNTVILTIETLYLSISSNRLYETKAKKPPKTKYLSCDNWCRKDSALSSNGEVAASSIVKEVIFFASSSFIRFISSAFKRGTFSASITSVEVPSSAFSVVEGFYQVRPRMSKCSSMPVKRSYRPRSRLKVLFMP